MNDSIATSLWQIGKGFQDKTMDYLAAITTFQILLNRYPKYDSTGKVLYNLYLSAFLNKDKVLADSAYQVLLKNYATSSWVKLLQEKPLDNNMAITSIQNDTTKVYDAVYQLFLLGKFEEAKLAKAQADKQFGNHYWTPQLLYIEAVYFAHNGKDDSAAQRLESIPKKFSTSPIIPKAKIFLDVLKNRKNIEEYLSKLKIEPYQKNKKPVIAKTNFDKPLVNKKKDDDELPYVKQEMPQLIKMAFNDRPNNLPSILRVKEKKVSYALMTSQEFIRKLLGNEKDSSLIATIPDKDSTIKATESIIDEVADTKLLPTYVVVVLKDVDPVYVNEAGNAFNRYNMAMFANANIEVHAKSFGERYNVVLMGPFKNVREAKGYVSVVGNDVSSAIIPWLDTDRYWMKTVSKERFDEIEKDTDVEKYLSK